MKVQSAFVALVCLLLLPSHVAGQDPSRGPILIDGDDAFEGPGSGVVRGRGTAADPYLIEGWLIDVRGNPDAPGIQIRNTHAHVRVLDCTVLKDKPGKGIHIHKAKNVKVRGCKVIDHEPLADDGPDLPPSVPEPSIEVENSTGVEIRDNTVTTGEPPDGPPAGTSVLVANSTDVLVSGNDINRSSGNGIEAYEGTHVSIVDNTVSENAGSGIVVNGSGSTVVESNDVAGNQDGGIVVEHCDRVEIVDNTVDQNGGDGVVVRDSEGAVLAGNNATSNTGQGIAVEDSPAAEVTNNTVVGNAGDGIVVEAGPGATINGNVVEGNGGTGVAIEADGATVANNTAASNGGGGIVVEGDAVSVEFNAVADNEGFGVSIISDDPATSVEGNEVSDGDGPGVILVPPGPALRDNSADVIQVEPGYDPRTKSRPDSEASPTVWPWLIGGAVLAGLAAFLVIRRLRA